MGVDFHCNDIGYGCSYSHWNEIRSQIIEATIEYLEKKFEDDLQNPDLLNPYDDATYIGDPSDYNCCMIIMNKIIKELRQNIDVNAVIRTFYKLSHIDALVYFDVGGLYSLCNKSDCSGYYSPGNSYDICKLLDLLEPFMKTKPDYEAIYVKEYSKYYDRVYDLFEESWKTKTNIRIS